MNVNQDAFVFTQTFKFIINYRSTPFPIPYKEQYHAHRVGIAHPGTQGERERGRERRERERRDIYIYEHITGHQYWWLPLDVQHKVPYSVG